MTLTAPVTSEQFDRYYQLRWRVLRQPWQQAKGSEQDELESQSFHRMIVDEHDQVIAVGRLHGVDQFTAQVRYMAVAPEYQGQGLGEKILSALEKVAVEVGFREIQLNAREQALAFYQRLNYQNLGQSHLLYGSIQHYQMSKALTPVLTEQALVNELEQTWHRTIPMSAAMNLAVASFSEHALLCHCDLNFNKNLHNTMFAGSIYTLATLTGWGWLHLMLAKQGLNADIVLGKADIRYHAPLAGVAYAKVDSDIVKLDTEQLSEKGKVRVLITVEVFCGDTLAATFSGNYFALVKNNS